MKGRFGRMVVASAGTLVLWTLLRDPALAQAHNPFGVGISEGGGSASGLTGWLLAEQATFERQLSTAVRAARSGGVALAWLIGLSFTYGVFHAAGPGHGKAVMASYLFANERALKRGMILSLLAACLQGLVAIVLVGILAMLLHATAQRMKDAASLVESLSYAGIAVLGAWLVWQKGRRFVVALLAPPPASFTLPFAPALASAATTPSLAPASPSPHLAYALAADCGCAPVPGFMADGVHGPDCGHWHAPDPATLGEGFSWREAILTVIAAGSRPCSGAILVLVFALAQGLFAMGIAAVVAMSLGTAVTTGALAALAVLAKGLTMRMTRPGSRRGTLVVRGLETAAAAVVLAAGLSLFFGFVSLGGA